MIKNRCKDYFTFKNNYLFLLNSISHDLNIKRKTRNSLLKIYKEYIELIVTIETEDALSNSEKKEYCRVITDNILDNINDWFLENSIIDDDKDLIKAVVLFSENMLVITQYFVDNLSDNN